MTEAVESSAPQEEEIEGAEETIAPPAPESWLDDVAPKIESDTAKPVPESIDGIQRMLTAVIGLVMLFISDKTHWDGWKLTPEETEAYNTVFAELFRDIKFKQARLVTALFSLVAINLLKLQRYREWKGGNASALGTLPKAPPGAP